MTEITCRKAYSYDSDVIECGHYISQMKRYATTEVAEENADRVRGSIFNDMLYACNFIGVRECIRKDMVYPALRMIGANWCYSEFKSAGGDVFSDIQELVDRCVMSRDRDLRMVGSEVLPIFSEVQSKVYRVPKATKAVMVKQAESSGINTSHLNLYHALCGLKVLVKNEPEYILMRNEEVFIDPLRVLSRADKSLLRRKKTLLAVLD